MPLVFRLYHSHVSEHCISSHYKLSYCLYCIHDTLSSPADDASSSAMASRQRLFYDPANPRMLSIEEIQRLTPSDIQAASDQIDQNMVILLQRIEEDFARCNQVVIERILPAVAQHGENSQRIYESVKVRLSVLPCYFALIDASRRCSSGSRSLRLQLLSATSTKTMKRSKARQSAAMGICLLRTQTDRFRSSTTRRECRSSRAKTTGERLELQCRPTKVHRDGQRTRRSSTRCRRTLASSSCHLKPSQINIIVCDSAICRPTRQISPYPNGRRSTTRKDGRFPTRRPPTLQPTLPYHCRSRHRLASLRQTLRFCTRSSPRPSPARLKRRQLRPLQGDQRDQICQEIGTVWLTCHKHHCQPSPRP